MVRICSPEQLQASGSLKTKTRRVWSIVSRKVEILAVQIHRGKAYAARRPPKNGRLSLGLYIHVERIFTRAAIAVAIRRQRHGNSLIALRAVCFYA